MPPHAFAKTSPVPGGTSLSRHSPLIFMKCLRHLLALLRKCPAQGWPWRPPSRAQPLPSTGDLHFMSFCALSPWGTHVAHVCAPRLHCLVVCWMEPRARGSPKSLTTEDNCQAPSTHCLLWCWAELRASFVCLFVCLFTLNLCLAVSD